MVPPVAGTYQGYSSKKYGVSEGQSFNVILLRCIHEVYQPKTLRTLLGCHRLRSYMKLCHMSVIYNMYELTLLNMI